MSTPDATVLLVEDEDSFVEALTVGLKREGFRVQTAHDGAEALELFDVVKPDLVLLDVMLPKISGVDVCRELRRRPQDGSGRAASGEVLEVGDVRLDAERHEVEIRGEPVRLPLKEFELLEILLTNAGRVLTRDTLIDRVWGTDYVGDTKTLDVHVKRLRSKVEVDPSAPRHLVTVRGLGYKFEA